MEENIEYWVWLQGCLGINNRRMKAAVKYFETPENMYRANETELRLYGGLSETDIERLLNKNLDNTKRAIEHCMGYGFDIIPYQSRRYPRSLEEIASPPIILYVKGTLPDRNKPHIGVVGTRNPDETGRQLSYNFGFDIAKSNAVVVSGGAYGIDLYAHKGAVDAEGETICVLGCGMDQFQYKTIQFIMNEIPEKGAVITEYPLGYSASKSTFPIRDRIISGISDCVLTVQAGLGSGALIAAKYAIQQNRKLFAVPGSAGSPNSTGSNILLKLGFSVALDYRDVLKWWYYEKQNPTPPETFNPLLSSRQVKELSVKPETLEFRNTEQRKLKSPVGYEQCVALYEKLEKSKKTDITESQMKLTSMENKKPKSVITEQRENPTEKNSVETVKQPEQTQSESVFEERQTEQTESRSVFNEKLPMPETIKKETEKKTPATKQKNVPEFDPKKMYNGLPRSEIAQGYLDHPDKVKSMSDMGLASMFGTKEINGIVRVKEEKNKQTEQNIIKREVLQSPTMKTEGKKNHDKVSISKNEAVEEKNEDVNVKIKEIERKILSEQLTELALTVYDTISDIPIHSDTIKLKTGLSIQDVSSSLTELTVMGYAKELPGRRYIRKS